MEKVADDPNPFRGARAKFQGKIQMKSHNEFILFWSESFLKCEYTFTISSFFFLPPPGNCL